MHIGLRSICIYSEPIYLSLPSSSSPIPFVSITKGIQGGRRGGEPPRYLPSPCVTHRGAGWGALGGNPGI